MAAVPPSTNPYYYGTATPAPPATDNTGERQIVVAPTVSQWGDVLSPAPTNHAPLSGPASQTTGPNYYGTATGNTRETQIVTAPNPSPWGDVLSPAPTNYPASRTTSSEEIAAGALVVANNTESEIAINPFSGEPLSAAAEPHDDAAASETPPPAAAVSSQSVSLILERREKLQREKEEQRAKIPQQHQQKLVSNQLQQRPQPDFAQYEKLRKLKERRKVRQAVAAGTGTIVGGVLLGPIGAVAFGISAHQATKHTGRAAEKRRRKRYEQQARDKAQLKKDEVVLS